MPKHHLQSLLATAFPKDGVGVIMSFFRRGFSDVGEDRLEVILMSAHTHGIKYQDVLEVFEREWEKTWKHQEPENRGDCEADGKVGISSRFSLDRIYWTLEVTNPLTEIIPHQKIVVLTDSGSIYQFSEVGVNGMRLAWKNHAQFGQGRLIHLVEGEHLQFVHSNGMECTSKPVYIFCAASGQISNPNS